MDGCRAGILEGNSVDKREQQNAGAPDWISGGDMQFISPMGH